MKRILALGLLLLVTVAAKYRDGAPTAAGIKEIQNGPTYGLPLGVSQQFREPGIGHQNRAELVTAVRDLKDNRALFPIQLNKSSQAETDFRGLGT